MGIQLVLCSLHVDYWEFLEFLAVVVAHLEELGSGFEL